ncbi:MAG: FAD-dependent monooxygenase [Phycicoccus sp.]
MREATQDDRGDSTGGEELDHGVVVVGGGPTGMVLAAELTLGGADVVILERRTDTALDGSRAGGLHSRTLELFDQRGVAERFVDAGQVHHQYGFALIPFDIGDLPTRHSYVLALWQNEIERLLRDWLDELGVEVRRGHEVVAVEQDEHGVDLTLADRSVRRAGYVVGCDGGRSVVRTSAGIGFPGLEPTTSWMIAEVETDEEPELGIRRDAAGTHAIGRRAPHEPLRVVLTEREVRRGGEPSLDELRAALVGVYGTDFGLRHAVWTSRFTDASRQAESYRRGRVLLAGDAAHVHPPQSGQGLNTGVQDAVNLGWKLARVVTDRAPESLLDSYHAERHPAGAQVQEIVMAQVALGRSDERHESLRSVVGELLAADDARRGVAARLCGLDVRYDLAGDHPIVGRRMPDLDLVTAEGPTTVYSLMHDARPLVLVLGEVGADGSRGGGSRGGGGRGTPDLPGRSRTDVVVERVVADDVWRLPVIGDVPAPATVVIRPDGHVAWAGDPADDTLAQVISTWFGVATAS